MFISLPVMPHSIACLDVYSKVCQIPLPSRASLVDRKQYPVHRFESLAN